MVAAYVLILIAGFALIYYPHLPDDFNFAHAVESRSVEAFYFSGVTLTTVGYGDIAPATALGQSIAALAVMLGYAMLAVTGGIITAELTNEIRESRQRRQCPHCERSGHEIDARYCKFCGGDLESTSHKQSDQATTHDKLD